jgi:hypothetical protein
VINRFYELRYWFIEHSIRISREVVRIINGSFILSFLSCLILVYFVSEILNINLNLDILFK